MNYRLPRLSRILLPTAVPTALALASVLFIGGCKQSASGGDGQNGQAAGQQTGQKQAGQKQTGQQKPGGGSAGELKEPNDSTTGENSGRVAADSDDGSPRAVTRTPNAMPGAPVATTKDKEQNSPENPTPPPASHP
jgi:hypothetical protein